MRWKLSEFIYEMEQDNERRVLFVEGITDQVFWSKTLQLPRRSGTVVYAISCLDCDAVSGGERGRLNWAAEKLSSSPIGQRLQFFADADFDRLLQKKNAGNMILTDGRDLESYFFLGNCCDHVCGVVQPNDPDGHTTLKGLISAIARPLGLLRLASERHGLELPFLKTFERGLSRFIRANGSGHELDMLAVARALMQNAGLSLTKIPDILGLYENEISAQETVRDNQLVHGKDLARVIAWKFSIPQSFAEHFVMLALATEVAAIRSEPNIQSAAAWLVQ
jgi:hypothetical protein